MIDLRSIFDSLEIAGIFEIFLPFILVFSLVFAILEKVKLFGENRRGIHGVVAISLALLVANNDYIVEVLHRFLPNIAFFMIVILAVIMLLSTMTGEEGGRWLNGNKSIGIGITIAIIFAVWSLISDEVGDFFGGSQAWDWLYYVGEDNMMIIFMVLIFLGVILFTGKNSNPNTPPATRGTI